MQKNLNFNIFQVGFAQLNAQNYEETIRLNFI